MHNLEETRERMRINELAKELEVKAKAILDVLPELGVSDKRTHSSAIEDDLAEKIRRHFSGKSASASAAERPHAAEIKPKIDFSKVHKPGDVFRQLKEQQEQKLRPIPPRPPVTAAAPPAVVPKPPVKPLAPPPVQERPTVIAPKAPATPPPAPVEKPAIVSPPPVQKPVPPPAPVQEKPPAAPPAVVVTPPTQQPVAATPPPPV